jgi:hypothetical protein
MRKAIAFLTVFVMSISLFAQTDVAKYGDKGAPEVRIPQTWYSNSNRTEDFLLVLSDSWGDGWDGASMDVLVNGTAVYTAITVAAFTAEFTLALNDGDIVQTAYTECGCSYEAEHSYAFYDNNSVLVASDGPSPGAGITFTASVSSDVPGCMTAAACNYSADATADDGSCCLTNCTTIAMGGGSYIGETSWSIADAAGNIIASGAGAESSEFSCFDDGDYTATGSDSYGDGWNGNTLTVTGDDGTVYLSWDGPSADLAGGESASVTFTVAAPPPPAVFFSEYAEGSSNNKYLEVYNGTDATISLDDFVILGNYNGNPWSETFTFVAGATVESGGVYVIANSSASDAIQALADELLAYGDPWYTAAFNGDDVRALATADGTVLDIIGTLDGDGDGTSGEGSEDDPGGGFDVAGVSEATKDHTLVRKDAVMEGNGGDWAASAGTTADDSEYSVEDKPTADYTPATLGWHIIDPSVTYSANFAIDMNGTGYPNDAYPSVVINGSWNSWAGWGVELADADMDGIYTGTLSGLAEATMIEYVVAVTGESDGWSGWGVIFNAPLGSDCDYVPTDEYGNYGFTIMGADVNLAHIAGSCITCAANLASVNMVDAWGDGWNGNVLTIGTVELTIESGAAAFAELCLEDGSYVVTCDDGSYQSEVSWEILNAAGEVLLAGGAPYAGVLQLGETTDVLGCTDADALNYDENATVNDGSCFYAGDSCLIALAAVVGSNEAPDAPTWYTYTASLTGTATISSVGGGVDTQVYGYSGTCDALTEVGFGDDEGGSPEWSSIMVLDVVAGESYYILWTAFWSSAGFVWTLEEALPPTSPENLTAEAGVESVSLEWDGYIASSNRSVANNNRGMSIEDANAAYLAKMNDLKGDEPTEVHRFSVVHPDYASNSRSTDVIIACGGGTWESEVSWEILNDAGVIVAFGGAPSDTTASLDNGVYTVNGYDAYGDGWNGNMLTVTGATDNYPWLNFTLTVDDADFATTTFTMSDTPPELANLNITNGHYDAATDAIIITVNNTGGLPSGQFFITYYFQNPLSGVCENQDYDTWDSFDDGLGADSSYTYVVQEDVSMFIGAGTFEIGAFIDWGCTVAESNEDDNTASATIEVVDPWEGVTWNVYRSEAGAEFASVGVADSMDYTDEGLTGDVEYCYYVTQVDTEGAAESDASNTACATPIVALDLPVPTDLTAEADGYNVMVNWMSPDLTGFGTMSYTPLSGEKEDDVSTYIAYDPSDYPSPARQGGEDIATAVAIDALPYNNTGTTDGYTDDYDEACPYTGSTSPDVVYSFTPATATAVDVSLCGEGTGYDTKVYVYENEAGALASTVDGGEASACNDDECENSTTSWLSFLPGVLLNEGNTYYIVVDGYGGASGAYEIEITEVDLPDPPSPVMGYNVYRGDEIVGSTDHVDSTSFAEFVSVEGDHTYYTTAVYDIFGESDPSNSSTVTVEAPAPTCSAPQNLMAESLGNDVSLSWDAPEGGAGWFGYNDGVFVTAVGTNSAAQFSVAIRFGQEELADYNGMALSKVRFAHNEPTAFYQVAIWTAEAGGSPVLLDTTDWMDGAEIPANEFYEVELDESITIDWSQELWIGYNIDTPAGFPAGCDGGPAVTGYGDLIALGGPFQSMNAAYGLNYNWMIDGFADYADGRSIASMAPINVEYLTPTTTSEPEEHRLPTPIVINTPGERDMTNYILYRDGEAEDTLDIDVNTYYDIDVEWGDHNYYVTALYNNSAECGESEPSNTVDVSLVNHAPPPVMLLQPDDGATIVVSESNAGDDFPFIWTAVNDEDNDPVMYVVSATDEDGSMSDTSMAVAGWFPTIGELAAPLLEDSVAVMTYSWNVWASDPWDSTASSNGPRSLTIDVSGLLALDGIGLPDVFSLHNNYPNPFNPVTNITYDIPEVAQVTLDIYNVSGQKVRTLAQGQHEPGRYRIQWNATNDYGNPLSSGMYIYRIHAGDFVSVKKLILMK